MLEIKRILILGGSGFVGNALYKELHPYFDTHCTYFTSGRTFAGNQKFHRYDLQEDDIVPLLETISPQLIISALRGDFASQVQAHLHMMEYLEKNEGRIYFISSANVFDAYSKYPSYEYDKTLSMSIYGRLKIKIENMLLRLPPEKMAIIRVPMIFGNNSPRIKEIKELLAHKEPLEVFPNLIMNVTSDDRLTQQIHYMINRNRTGIYHLGSTDLVHHEDFVTEIVKKIGLYNPVFKRVFTSNEDRYLAVLPKSNKLPKNLQLGYQDVIDHHIFG
ncbi:MAG: sugar nucleotide-binding protein [Sediminicola sp.]|tara:strand:- start:49827 stop:50651 length:825 start_codon:yes stop_codon:yes gene_type:complete